MVQRLVTRTRLMTSVSNFRVVDISGAESVVKIIN